MAGLLDDPLLNIGIGLLASSGPSTQPIGLGQALGNAVQFANQREQALLQNQFMRDKIEFNKQRREAFKQAQDFISRGESVPLPILSLIDPGVAAQIAAQAGQQDTGLALELERNRLLNQRTQLQIADLLGKISERGEERTEEKEQEVSDVMAEADDIVNILSSARTIAATESEIPVTGTAGKFGQPLVSVLDSFNRVIGGSPSELNAAVTRFKQSTNNIVARAAEAGLSQAALRAVREGKPTLDNPFVAIERGIDLGQQTVSKLRRVGTKEALERARIVQDEIDRSLEFLRQTAPQSGAPSGVDIVSDAVREGAEAVATSPAASLVENEFNLLKRRAKKTLTQEEEGPSKFDSMTIEEFLSVDISTLSEAERREYERKIDELLRQ